MPRLKACRDLRFASRIEELQIDAEDPAGDVEGVVDGLLEFVVGGGFDLLAVAEEASQAGAELAVEGYEAGIVAAGVGVAAFDAVDVLAEVLDAAVEVGDAAGEGGEFGGGVFPLTVPSGHLAQSRGAGGSPRNSGRFAVSVLFRGFRIRSIPEVCRGLRVGSVCEGVLVVRGCADGSCPAAVGGAARRVGVPYGPGSAGATGLCGGCAFAFGRRVVGHWSPWVG